MSSVSALPWTQQVSRISFLARASRAHERQVAFLLALTMAAIAFAPRVKAGGLLADDWPLYSAVKFPQAHGFHSSLAALQHSAGSRIGHMLYWLVGFSLFAGHTKLYAAAGALLAVVMAFSVYILLRELRFSFGQSLAMMVLTIVAPSIGTVRFWFTDAGVQICLSLFFLGLTLALRAFAAPEKKRLRMHIASWGFYLASAAYAEMALPLMGVCILVYLTRAGIMTSLRRWVFDMAIVLVGYLATLSFVNTQKGFGKLPASMWGVHARLMADQALTILTATLGPFADDERTLELTVLGMLVTAGFVLLRRGSISCDSRRELQRWGFAFFVCVTAIMAGYAVYVPAMLYYEPLGPGLATHINVVIAAPLAIGVFAVLMFARVVLLELLDGFGRRYAGYLVLGLVVAWYAGIFIDSTKDVRRNGYIWASATGRAYHVLRVLTVDLPHPVSNATMYTFGEAGTAAPGLPIFFTSWELNNAVKVAYNRPDLSSYPVVVNGIGLSCARQGVMVSVESIPINVPSPYRKSYFMDISSGNNKRIDSRAACTAAMSKFHPGPYATISPAWSQ